MMRKLPLIMHVLVITALLLAAVALIGNDLTSRGLRDGDLGMSLFFALMYMVALIMGSVGWILSISVIFLLRKDKAQTHHKWLALVYIVVGAGGLSLAYYYMQAS